MAQNDRPAIAGPTIVGSVRRFRRIVIFITAAALIITLFYLVIAPTKYTGKVGIIIVPPPASLTTGASPVHVSAATFNSAQVALIQSNAVAQGAAAIVNSNFSDANLTGPQVQGATAVKLPTAGSTSNQGSTTQILVTLSSPDIAAATANAVASAYLAAVRAQIRQQAGHSISALQAEYNSVQGELKGIPAPTSRSSSNSTSTTTTTHPTTTTTHPPPDDHHPPAPRDHHPCAPRHHHSSSPHDDHAPPDDHDDAPAEDHDDAPAEDHDDDAGSDLDDRRIQAGRHPRRHDGHRRVAR